MLNLQEILQDERVAGFISPSEEQLIGQFCDQIEDKIRHARSRKEAWLVVYDACRECENLCDNDVLVTHLKRYVEHLYQNLWGMR